MKIAIASDDGRAIAAHFGRCSGFAVLTVEGGRVVSRETREVAGKPAGHEHSHGHEGDACACLTNPAQGHQGLLVLIGDCDAVVCLGMGPRAANALKTAGVRPVVLPNPTELEEAALAVANGRVGPGAPGSGCCCREEL